MAGAPAGMYEGQSQGNQTEIADCLFYNVTTIDANGTGLMTGKDNIAPASMPIQSISRTPADFRAASVAERSATRYAT